MCTPLSFANADTTEDNAIKKRNSVGVAQREIHVRAIWRGMLRIRPCIHCCNCRGALAVDCSAAMNTTFETIYDAVGQVAATLPANPAEPYFAAAWMYMLDNYSKFTIATWFSLIWHEVKIASDTGTCTTSRGGDGSTLTVCLLPFVCNRWCILDYACLGSSASSCRRCPASRYKRCVHSCVNASACGARRRCVCACVQAAWGEGR